MQKLSEKDIENQILAWLWSKRIFAWKNQSVGVFDPVKKIYRKSNNKFHLNGVSDILGVYNGKFLAIEVKSSSGKLTESQLEFIKRVESEGGIAILARCIEDVEKTLITFGVNSA